MTKRDFQAAEYAAERHEDMKNAARWLFTRFEEEDRRRDAARASRRDSLSIRVHRATSKFCRFAWLKFLGR